MILPSRLDAQQAEPGGRNVERRDWAEPGDYQTNDPRTGICYRGDGAQVYGAVAALAGWALMSDQLSVHGWRYKHTKFLAEPLSEGEDANFPAIWHQWRGDGEAVLFVTACSDGGEETNPGLVYKCRWSSRALTPVLARRRRRRRGSTR